jgi:LPXTG-motif cell wall-anchored protein
VAHRLFVSSIVIAAVVGSLLQSAAIAQADPVATFQQAVDARNRGDLDGVMRLMADDAVRQDGSCQPNCTGQASLRRSFQQNIDEHFQATVLAAQANGSTVTARAELRSDVFRASGAERVISDFNLQVRDGKISRWSSTLDTNDPQTAAYRAAVQAQAAQSQPAAAPNQLPNTGASVDARWLATIGGLLAVSGLGFSVLGYRRRPS